MTLQNVAEIKLCVVVEADVDEFEVAAGANLFVGVIMVEAVAVVVQGSCSMPSFCFSFREKSAETTKFPDAWIP